MRKFLKVIWNIIRGTFKLVVLLLYALFMAILKGIFYNKKTCGVITPRKAARIRFFSKIKLFFMNVIPESLLSFFGILQYKKYINENLKNGLQLR